MKQYVKSIDSLRTLSILAVIAIHVTTRTLEAAKFDLIGFPLTIFLNQIARFAVPLFILISGFVLEINFEPEMGYLAFIKKRFARIFIPYIFWSAIYYFFIYTQNHDNFLRVILTGDASYQLYFIPTLCIFYMVFPLLHKMYKYLAQPLVFMVLGMSQIWFLNNDYFVKAYKYTDPIHIAILGYFFFIVGIVAARSRDKINSLVHKWKYPLLFVVVGMGTYVFLEGRGRYLSTGNFFAYYSQWRPSVLIYTILIGLVFFHLFEKTKLQFFLTEKLSKLSFLVFFIHVIVLEGVWSLFGKNLFNLLSVNRWGKYLFDPIFFVVVTGFSFLAAYLVHKIPKLYKLTG